MYMILEETLDDFFKVINYDECDRENVQIVQLCCNKQLRTIFRRINMKRLTDETGLKVCDNCKRCEHLCDAAEKAIEKLKDYEDKEENGLLVRLPLKKGSKVYSAKEEYTVTEIRCFDDFELKFIAENDYSAIRFDGKDIDKTVFLTQAEAKLKEMEGKNADNCNDTKSTK